MSIKKIEHELSEAFNPETKLTEASFDMVVTYPGNNPNRLFTQEEYETHLAWLGRKVPEGSLSTFVVGSFTDKFLQDKGHLDPEYINLVKSVHHYYRRINIARILNNLPGRIEDYSCFERENYGLIKITSKHATVLDRMALDRSNFITILPGATDSQGTWKEIVYTIRSGKDIVGLQKEGDPSEEEFLRRIINARASIIPVNGLRTSLTIITFEKPDDLFPQLGQVVQEMLPNGNHK